MTSNLENVNFDASEPDSPLPAAAAALSPEDRAGLVNALKNKLHVLAGHHTEIMETLPPQVQKRVESLKEIQGQHDELEAKFLEEREELEAKYQKLYEPLYTRRFEIVNGVVEVDGVTDTSLEQDNANEGKGVPEFWVTALKTNEILAEEISERDEEALKHLKDIKWSKIDSPKGFKLEFFFDANPFFKNLILTKTYHMVDEDEPMLEKAVGTQIEWCPGKCLTQKVLKKKPKKGAKNAKPIMKTEKCESFFNFFSPPEVPEDIDEDEAEELQNLMEQDYDIGSTIRDRIIPYAVSWFTGEAVEDDDELDMVADNDDDDDDEEEEEEDENADANEEDEEEEVKPTKKKGAVVRVGEAQQGRGQFGEGQQGRVRVGEGQQGRGRGRAGEGQLGRGRVGEGQQGRGRGRAVEAEQRQVGESEQGGSTPECKQQ